MIYNIGSKEVSNGAASVHPLPGGNVKEPTLYVMCPICKTDRPVTKDGKFRKHRDYHNFKVSLAGAPECTASRKDAFTLNLNNFDQPE